jgi:hypothetical protein
MGAVSSIFGEHDIDHVRIDGAVAPADSIEELSNQVSYANRWYLALVLTIDLSLSTEIASLFLLI